MPKIMKVSLVAAFVILVFMPLLHIHTGDSDFYRYFLWSKAFSQGDIFSLGGNILSPQGIPLSQWSFGPGLIFSLGTFLNSATFDNAVLVGWLFAVIFWISYTGILLKVAKNNHILVLFGLCITFIATPLGYYSSAYGSESLSYTCLSVMIFWLLAMEKFTVSDYLMVGIYASLLLVIRSQLILYIMPVALVIMYKIRDEFLKDKMSLKPVLMGGAAFFVPIFFSLLAVSTVNYWMTGSYFDSVYNFGFGDFSSVDFGHPEWWAVLMHPWHGLFAYHPLYLPCFLSLPVFIYTRHEVRLRLLFAIIAIALFMHIYLHASWYVWWLGLGSFGMRGLSISVVVLMPMMLHQMAAREEQGKSNSALILLILLMSLWSFALLTQEVTQYYTYPQLFGGVKAALDNLIEINFFLLPLLLFVVWFLTAGLYGRQKSAFCFKNIATALLLLLLIHYQSTLFFYKTAGMTGCSFISVLLMLLLPFGYYATVEVSQKHYLLFKKTFVAVSSICYLSLVSLFANLALTTHHVIAAKASPPSYTLVSRVDVNEVRTSNLEYMNVPGFLDKKVRLQHYLEYLDSADNATLRLINRRN